LIKNIREVAELSGWTYPVQKFRQKKGRFIEIKPKNRKHGTFFRFCDLITTHTMRKTAITNFLSLGMPEQMVRRISGHSPGSIEFYRYVNFAQAYLDGESDKVFQKLA
jgi:intergrase/recombinase